MICDRSTHPKQLPQKRKASSTQIDTPKAKRPRSRYGFSQDAPVPQDYREEMRRERREFLMNNAKLRADIHKKGRHGSLSGCRPVRKREIRSMFGFGQESPVPPDHREVMLREKRELLRNRTKLRAGTSEESGDGLPIQHHWRSKWDTRASERKQKERSVMGSNEGLSDSDRGRVAQASRGDGSGNIRSP